MAWTSKLFSDRVMTILQELDFHNFKKVTKNVFKATLKLGKIEVPVVINIYYSRKKAITDDEVKMFFADISMVKGFVKGIFIGYPEFSKKAKEVAEKLDIITLDMYELLNSLIDTDNYRKTLKDIYKDQLINYIPHNLSNKEINIEFNSFINVVERSENSPIFVEGDIGIGKTTLLKSVIQNCGKKSFKNIKNRIPFYIDLKKYNEYYTLSDFIYHEVFLKNNIKLRTDEAFDILCNEKRMIFLIDNIDKITEAESEKIFKLAHEFKQLADKGVLLVFTAPGGYFSVDFKNKLYFTKFIKTFEDVNPKLFKIKHFSLAQIKQKLVNPKLQRIISRNEFLKEVCKIPVFLDIFSNLKIESEESLLKFSDIYKESIKQWESEYLTNMGKEMFCEEMAKAIFNQGDFNIKTDLPEYMENFIHNKYKALPFSIELVKRDIEKSFFIRDISDGKYDFIHSSFVYFFIAIRLIEEIKKGNYNNIFLLASNLILKFSEDYLGAEKIFDVIIERYTRERFARDKGEILFLIYQVAELLGKLEQIPLNRISTQRIEAQNKMLVNLKLNDIDFKESDFRNTDFRFSKCNKIDFTSSVMENVNMSYCDFKKSNFQSSNMKYLISKNSNFSESSFYKSNIFQGTCTKTDFSKSNFDHANLHGILAVESNFKQAEFMDVDISNGDFTKADFEQAVFENIKCKSGLFSYTNLKLAHIKDTSFPFSIFYYASFHETTLYHVDFSFLNMNHCWFDKSNLNHVKFKNADLRGGSFKDAVFKEVDFSGADLRGVNFKNAKLCDLTKRSLEKAIQ